MKNRTLVLLSITTGLLLTLAWPFWGFPIIALLAFVPLLFVFDQIHKYKHNHAAISGFTYSFLALLTWNALTTWWIWNSTSFGAMAAIILNSMFFAVPLGWYSFLRRKFFNSSKGYFALICLWLSFEYIHLDWDLSWPWLMLGNAFANYPILIQWYEITGAIGGSLWVLLANIFIYELFLSFKESKKNQKAWIALASIIIVVPIGYSIIRYFNYVETENPIEVVVIQQNTDPWEQYDIESEELIHNILELAREKTTSKTQLIVAPESAIQDYAWQNKLYQYPSIDSLSRFIEANPDINILMGISTLRMYENPNEKSLTARKYGGGENLYFDSYNTALFINSHKEVGMYHKTKLVPGVEKMPFPEYLGNLSEFALDLGGITGSLGTDNERKVFQISNSQAVVGSAICYESVYGEFFGEFVKNGANIMTIITNDGWWKKTPGYRQHFEYARLRAIETRRSIARAANTGTSGFINQRGDVLQKTEWWTPVSISQTLNLNSKITFYTKYGDFIGKISLYVSLIIALLFFLQLFFPAIRKIR